MTGKRPTGRRAGDSGTREAILDAALLLFAEHGFDGASMRAIAAEAEVDPALIRHYFGPKERLLAVLITERSDFPATLGDILNGDPQQAGRRITDAYLRLWDDPTMGRILLTLVRSATTSEQAAQMLREVLLARAGEVVAGTPVDVTRISLAAAQMFGIAIARHVVRLPALTTLDHDALVDLVAPTVQRYLDGE